MDQGFAQVFGQTRETVLLAVSLISELPTGMTHCCWLASEEKQAEETYIIVCSKINKRKNGFYKFFGYNENDLIVKYTPCRITEKR
jgi:hypothetical protein